MNQAEAKDQNIQTELPEKSPIYELSASSKFNIKFMWNVNKISIAIFVIAIVIKVISKLIE